MRDGIIGPRRPGSIGFTTLRGSSVVGEHTVIYAGEVRESECTKLQIEKFCTGCCESCLVGYK